MAYGVIAGGGRSERIGGLVPKLEIEILGKPLVVHTMKAFQEASSIAEVVVTMPSGSLEKWSPGEFQRFGISKVKAVIAGGATRQESVLLGLEYLEAAPDEIIVIHDGARPLVTPGMIDSICNLDESSHGLIYAVPVTDTVKAIEAGYVRSTLNRESLVAVQTPQAFRFEVILSAHRGAAQEGFTGTDDASLVERTGGTIRVLEGDRNNIKVTYSDDISMVESILKSRGK